MDQNKLYKVKISEEAQRELGNIVSYVALNSIQAARVLKKDIVAEISSLKLFPERTLSPSVRKMNREEAECVLAYINLYRERDHMSRLPVVMPTGLVRLCYSISWGVDDNYWMFMNSFINSPKRSRP